jgi:two-component system, NarL family, invasion response regulator UvrY
VLVVDDLAVFRSAASAVIKSTPGFWLAGEASSGEEAIELVTQQAPDFVLLDVNMPKLDGITTARLLARIDRTLITVLLSADEHPDIEADPHAYGAAAFLAKQLLRPDTLRELWSAHSTPVHHRDHETTRAPAIDMCTRGQQVSDRQTNDAGGG